MYNHNQANGEEKKIRLEHLVARRKDHLIKRLHQIY